MSVPNKNMNTYLVGFMGTGKTAVGKELAKRKNWQFADLDELIERKDKRKIAEIFAQDGEPHFRKLEKEALEEISAKGDFVVACGGGIVIDPENIKLMKETGTIVCLTASADVILERTSKFTHRPLLQVDKPKEKIEELLRIRAPYYAQADKTIDTSELSVREVVGRIIESTAFKK